MEGLLRAQQREPYKVSGNFMRRMFICKSSSYYPGYLTKAAKDLILLPLELSLGKQGGNKK